MTESCPKIQAYTNIFGLFNIKIKEEIAKKTKQMKMLFLTKLKEKQVPFDLTSFDWTLQPWLHISFGHWIPLGQVRFML